MDDTVDTHLYPREVGGEPIRYRWNEIKFGIPVSKKTANSLAPYLTDSTSWFCNDWVRMFDEPDIDTPSTYPPEEQRQMRLRHRHLEGQ